MFLYRSISRSKQYLLFARSNVNIKKTLSGTGAVSQYITHNERLFSTSQSVNDKLATKQVPKHDWNRAVSEAEKIVGYPTSFLTLRWLLSDEIANVALHIRKLIGTGSNHPLLKTAKNLLYNGKHSMQAWGLIVLLVSKAAGQAPGIPDLEQDKSAGVLHSQRALAEVAEMIRISHKVHQSLISLLATNTVDSELASNSDTIFGNKMALLGGDYLLGNSCAELARLKNQDLVELISSAVRDLAESEFIGERDEQNNPLPSRPKQRTEEHQRDINYDDFSSDVLVPMNKDHMLGIPELEWELRHILSAGSLLGKSCQGALKLAGHPESFQKQGYLFGKHLSLASQACIDMEPFQCNVLPLGGTFSLIAAPVLFHLEYDPSLYEEIEKGRVSVNDIDYNKIHKAVVNGPGLEKTRELQRKHSIAAMNVLKNLPPSDACTALQNIILAMQDL